MTWHTQAYASGFDLTLRLAFVMCLINVCLGMLAFLLLASIYSLYGAAPKAGALLADPAFWVALGEGSMLVVAASLFVTLTPVPFAWLWCRVFGGRGSVLGHLSRVLACTNLEWLNAVLAVTVVLPTIWNPELLVEHNAVARGVGDLATASVAGWLGLRLYYCLLQLIMLLPYHFPTKNLWYFLGGVGIVLFNAVIVVPYLLLYTMLLWPPHM